MYKSPGLKIDWYNRTIELVQFGNGSLDIEWDHEGTWCSYITDQIKEAKSKLELKREKNKRNEELKRKQEEKDEKRVIEEKRKISIAYLKITYKNFYVHNFSYHLFMFIVRIITN